MRQHLSCLGPVQRLLQVEREMFVWIEGDEYCQIRELNCK